MSRHPQGTAMCQAGCNAGTARTFARAGPNDRFAGLARGAKKTGPSRARPKVRQRGGASESPSRGEELRAYDCQSGRITAPHVTQQELQYANSSRDAQRDGGHASHAPVGIVLDNLSDGVASGASDCLLTRNHPARMQGAEHGSRAHARMSAPLALLCCLQDIGPDASMIRKSGCRFSAKITLEQNAGGR